MGGLAVVLGVGTVAFAGCAIASADSGSSDSSSPAASSAPAHSPARTRPAQGAGRTGAAQRIVRPAASSAAASPISVASRNPSSAQPLTTSPAQAVTAPVAVARAKPAAASAQNATADPYALPPKPSPQEIWTAVASSLVGVAQAALRAVSIAVHVGPTVSTLNQTLPFNGYSLVPSSTELVTSFYGQWTFWPGGPTLVQGQQQYSVVDPTTKGNVGSFGALVSTGSPFNLGSKYVELLVTSNGGTNVGAGPGQVPPVGSLISRFDLIGGFGWSYSAIPSPLGDVVTFKLLTPFGDIPLPFRFDAAKGIADHTVDNRPVNLGNGYSIVPADPTGETYVGTSGFLPYYTTVQAHEVFDIHDPSGNTLGSFEGVLTPTADVMGVKTEAILVTKVTNGIAGTTPGEVPPAGSVFNVMYEANGTTYAVYSSLPSQFGDKVSTILVNNGTVSNIGTFPLNLLDASALPPVKRLPGPGGGSLLPTSTMIPSGVNGLPPREIQLQGYQQFGIYDAAGVQQGSFDADVSTQLDMYGTYSQAILVTKVTTGTAGTGAGDVPPVGSMFNYTYFGNTGFGTYYADMPSASGDKVSFKILTPAGDVPTWSTYDASAGFGGVSFFDPFAAG
ncbi:hypothetical protein Y900_024505 [Mycolicibacterium aromaticivorans JS19b1 = JCM 16368]|uniref:Uncharacterized protein n=1 Tax=Mycolicibacterium aromaticivorans JS19b1 = JCM 16368 TaxID=1440774 RepID=A0A064CNR3_9MYCO|nr:hypothetical protein Y900_024505 [Mycolicibacterium aromaticivorans JS19b1 = JCM 16368]